jgi:hypothetical protein
MAVGRTFRNQPTHLTPGGMELTSSGMESVRVVLTALEHEATAQPGTALGEVWADLANAVRGELVPRPHLVGVRA